MDLCLAIADCYNPGVHGIYALAPVAYIEPQEFPTTRFAYARKIARISSLFFGLPGVANHQRSCIAVEWSEEIWQPDDIEGPYICEDACIEAAIRKADRDGTNVVVSALVQVQLAMHDDDNGAWLPITSLRLSHEQELGQMISF